MESNAAEDIESRFIASLVPIPHRQLRGASLGSLRISPCKKFYFHKLHCMLFVGIPVGGAVPISWKEPFATSWRGQWEAGLKKYESRFWRASVSRGTHIHFPQITILQPHQRCQIGYNQPDEPLIVFDQEEHPSNAVTPACNAIIEDVVCDNNGSNKTCLCICNAL